MAQRAHQANRPNIAVVASEWSARCHRRDLIEGVADFTTAILVLFGSQILFPMRPEKSIFRRPNVRPKRNYDVSIVWIVRDLPLNFHPSAR